LQQEQHSFSLLLFSTNDSAALSEVSFGIMRNHRYYQLLLLTSSFSSTNHSADSKAHTRADAGNATAQAQKTKKCNPAVVELLIPLQVTLLSSSLLNGGGESIRGPSDLEADVMTTELDLRCDGSCLVNCS
jgi:hypothetical protein